MDYRCSTGKKIRIFTGLTELERLIILPRQLREAEIGR